MTNPMTAGMQREIGRSTRNRADRAYERVIDE